MMFGGGLPGTSPPRVDMVHLAGWMTEADIPDTVQGLFEELIQPHWLPVSALDVATLLPEPEVDPDLVRNLWPRSPDWHEIAACASAEPKVSDVIFFGVDDQERPALPPAAVKAARDICYVCPVAVDCLLWALERNEEFGIWAGTTGRQRHIMQVALKEGRVTIKKLLEIYA